MAGEAGADRPGLVRRIESRGRPATPEDVWNAAIRAGADPARMALSLSYVLGELSYEAMAAGAEEEPAAVRYTLETGEVIEYDAGFHNPFKQLRYPERTVRTSTNDGPSANGGAAPPPPLPSGERSPAPAGG